MKTWIVKYEPAAVSDQLYEGGLALVDEESAIRIRKLKPAIGSLIGRLLPRVMLKEHGVAPKDMAFGVTAARKPYITTPGIDPPLAFNVSHDNGLIAMAFGNGAHGPPSFSLGVDVMKVRIPGRDTLASFIDTMEDQLTNLERRSLSSVPHDEALKLFFWIWTMKEAYTKALGLGLGFDFRRVEYDAASETVRVDGSIPLGWAFHKFTTYLGEDLYQGVVAERVDEEAETKVYSELEPHPWLFSHDAAAFVERCMREL
ncbi:4'-phosphopantetheinyl transferase [Hymenopellis radicata]|nr:4'-phosphopantetheinyl transferase [Hymenopellis radicata]